MNFHSSTALFSFSFFVQQTWRIELYGISKPKVFQLNTENLTCFLQKTVDASDDFPVVLKRAEEWLESHNLGKKGRKFAVLTDG